METNQLLTLSPSQLRRAAEVKEQIDRLNGELEEILNGGGSVSQTRAGGDGRRSMSSAAKARIAAAARERWAKYRAEKGGANPPTRNTAPKAPRTMSAAARKKIAAAQKARWAKLKAGKA